MEKYTIWKYMEGIYYMEKLFYMEKINYMEKIYFGLYVYIFIIYGRNICTSYMEKLGKKYTIWKYMEGRAITARCKNS